MSFRASYNNPNPMLRCGSGKFVSRKPKLAATSQERVVINATIARLEKALRTQDTLVFRTELSEAFKDIRALNKNRSQ